MVPQKMPFTHNQTEGSNEKTRTIACMHCKYQCPSTIFGPICGVCGHEMVTVIRM